MSEFAPVYHANPSQRTPCVLVLDASGSMDEIVPSTGRTRIDELNAGLAHLRQELMRDETAAQRVQLAIVCVGGPAGHADVLMDWTDALHFAPPRLSPGGQTPLAAGMRIALQQVEQQKRVLQQNGVGYTRPWIIVISDGEPSDDPSLWQAVTAECRAAEDKRRCVIFPIGVADGNMPVLQQLSSTPALKMSEARFRECFQWLSASLSSLSRSRPGQQVQLGPVNPWAMVGA